MPSDRFQIPDSSSPHPLDSPFAALLGSDLAAEVRSDFNEQLSVGATAAAASQHILSRFSNALTNPHEGPVVLLALAVLQWHEGQLHAVIREAALDLIHSGEALAAYPAPTADVRKQRQDILEQFAAALEQSNPVNNDNVSGNSNNASEDASRRGGP